MRIRFLAVIALLLASPALAQVTPGTSPLTGAKGGTNNAFMQFTGPATSIKTYALPNASDTIATIAAAQTLTNKTFNCANNTCTVRLGSDVTGTLVVGNGGTGQTSFTAHCVLLGASPIGCVNGTVGNSSLPLVSQGASLDPIYSQIGIAAIAGWGTGVQTAVGVNVGTAGAFVVNGGALGSPSSAGTMPAFTLGGAVTGGGQNVTGLGALGSSAHAVTSNSALALTSGPNGTTNPTFNVDSSTASAATGINIKGAAAGSGIAISALSSGSNENLTIDAKGSGTITLGGTSTGNIALSRALSTSLTFSPTTAGIVGTTTNDNTTAGNVGEFVSSIISAGSPVSLTNATPANVTSISLTAGDWDVWGNCGYVPAATTNTTTYISALNTTSATLPGTTNPDKQNFISYPNAGQVIASGNHIFSPTLQTRFSLSGTTTVFLICRADFTVSTQTAYGYEMARRRR